MFILPTGSHFEDFDLDPKMHDAVKVVLNQEENEFSQFVNQEEVTRIIFLSTVIVLSHFSVTILYKYFNGKQNIPQLSEQFQNQISKL